MLKIYYFNENLIMRSVCSSIPTIELTLIPLLFKGWKIYLASQSISDISATRESPSISTAYRLT